MNVKVVDGNKIVVSGIPSGEQLNCLLEEIKRCCDFFDIWCNLEVV